MDKKHAENKNTQTLFWVAVLLISFTYSVSAQKIMALDEALAANSEAMQVKLKAGTGMMKYLFGEFAVISTKNKENSVDRRELRDTLARSEEAYISKYKEEVWGNTEEKQNFVFLGHQTDTVLVNMATLFNFNSTMYSENRSASKEETTIINNSNETFVAFLTPASAGSPWVVEMNTQLGKEVQAPGGIMSSGKLTDGSSTIQIKPVRQWSTGKSSKLFPILGFELFLDDVCLAAVQSSKNAGSKKYVWIKNDVPKDQQLILATAVTTLMAMVDIQARR